MEISRNLINPNQLPLPSRAESERSAGNNRFASEQAAAENRSAGQANRRGGLHRGEIVEDKGSADYSELLQRSRANRVEEDYRPITPTAQEPLGVKKALDAYNANSDSLDNSGIELLPRVDRYV